MKRLTAIAVAALMLLPLFTACDGGVDETSSAESGDQPSQEVSKPMTPDENAKLVWSDDYADAENGFSSASDVYGTKAYVDGKAVEGYGSLPVSDTRYLFAGRENTRAAVLSKGYAVTLPGTDVEADFSLGKLRSKYTSAEQGYVLTASYESQNPYGANYHGLIETYYREWLTPYLESVQFLADNSIRRTRAAGETTEPLDGYTVTYYDMVINVNHNIEYPYYSVAILRPTNLYTHFWLFVLKSKTQMTSQMDAIVHSFRTFEKFGVPVNNVGSYELRVPDFWNDETKAYYDHLMNSDTVELGSFYAQNSPTYKARFEGEEGIGNKLDVFMTYFHMGWYGRQDDIDLTRLNSFAGGDGKNGLPVLELTYQFTDSNNALGGYTPMYDILRGRREAQFRKLAQDIKSYGHPVLFRLNNEMNTDWTSYCGMQTMLDPDVFIETWRYLYNIFVEEGVDNCIWIWNPIATSCPYSNWGDMLNYFPGEDYVQMIGLTSYQMNSSKKATDFKLFREMYTELYNKNTPYFDNYPAIIGEFGCAAGGDYVYDYSVGGYVVPENIELRRQNQARWITDMFDCFMHKNDKGYEFCKNICVATWFNANDYATVNGQNEIVNHLQLDVDLPLAMTAFREGYQKLLDARK